MTSAGITARNIAMTFRLGGTENKVLEKLDIDIAPGSFTTLLGPSGCGKSTLLKILGGILEPSSGDVTIGNLDVSDAVLARQVGLVLQRPALLPWKSAQANVELLRILARKTSRGASSAAEDALDLVGLARAADLLPHQLSGGMAQRVSIARALAMDPSILLMDEPFGALDAITRDEMNFKLAEIWKRTGKTIVFVTHSVSEAIFLSDVVHVMGTSPGRIIESLDVELQRPRGREVFETHRFTQYLTHLREQLMPRESGAIQ